VWVKKASSVYYLSVQSFFFSWFLSIPATSCLRFFFVCLVLVSRIDEASQVSLKVLFIPSHWRASSGVRRGVGAPGEYPRVATVSDSLCVVGAVFPAPSNCRPTLGQTNCRFSWCVLQGLEQSLRPGNVRCYLLPFYTFTAAYPVALIITLNAHPRDIVKRNAGRTCRFQVHLTLLFLVPAD
jgi:hypothetical protein